jgi:hypothetical protein
VGRVFSVPGEEPGEGKELNAIMARAIHHAVLPLLNVRANADGIRLNSWATHSDWNHPYTVFAAKCVGTRAYRDSQRGRLSHPPRVDSVSELEEVGRRFLDPGLAPKFYLEGCPGSCVGNNYDIHLQTRVVPIVKNLGVGGLGVDAEVSNYHRFKEEPKQFEVLPQLVGAGPKCSYRQGGVHQVALWCVS